MQSGPMLSPDQFRTYIKPVYERLMTLVREKGCIVHMHSDGDNSLFDPRVIPKKRSLFGNEVDPAASAILLATEIADRAV
jgi:hypothetical protein